MGLISRFLLHHILRKFPCFLPWLFAKLLCAGVFRLPLRSVPVLLPSACPGGLPSGLSCWAPWTLAIHGLARGRLQQETQSRRGWGAGLAPCPPVAGSVPGLFLSPPRRGLSSPCPGPCLLPRPPGASALLVLGTPNVLLVSCLHTESAQKIEEEKEQPPPQPPKQPCSLSRILFSAGTGTINLTVC